MLCFARNKCDCSRALDADAWVESRKLFQKSIKDETKIAKITKIIKNKWAIVRAWSETETNGSHSKEREASSKKTWKDIRFIKFSSKKEYNNAAAA